MNKFIPVGDFKLLNEEKDAILDVLNNGRISEWKKVKEFEKLFAEYVGTKYCVAVSSGTSALLLGLLALKYDKRFLKFKNGAKIITSPVTYVATSNAIVLSNMQPVYADIDKRTFKLKINEIEKILEDNDPNEFAGVLPIHLMGYPNDMEEINKIARDYDLVVFEDSAQAHGTLYKGKKTGSLGLLADFSFYIAHNIQAGEMGCLTTNDEKLYKLMLKLKANGRMCDCQVCMRSKGKCPYLLNPDKNNDFDPRFTHEFIGYNFKTMEFQAALACCQMKKVDEIFEKRLNNVKYLTKKLSIYKNIFYLPKVIDTVSYLAYPIIIKENVGLDRMQIEKKLLEKGIESRPLFGCIPTQQPAYSYLKEKYAGRLPNAEYVGSNGFYIGCHQYLEKEDLDFIIKSFKEVLKSLLKEDLTIL
ncbi:putative aminotransferase [groundwater metagenome]|uniref:Putative aminotransferase n=1 Tax=groundwater metagenome TaxID=717931 RepID=A0A098EEC8_9ZZZZ